jgi:hypothetical protein
MIQIDIRYWSLTVQVSSFTTYIRPRPLDFNTCPGFTPNMFIQTFFTILLKWTQLFKWTGAKICYSCIWRTATIEIVKLFSIYFKWKYVLGLPDGEIVLLHAVRSQNHALRRTVPSFHQVCHFLGFCLTVKNTWNSRGFQIVLS